MLWVGEIGDPHSLCANRNGEAWPRWVASINVADEDRCCSSSVAREPQVPATVLVGLGVLLGWASS